MTINTDIPRGSWNELTLVLQETVREEFARGRMESRITTSNTDHGSNILAVLKGSGDFIKLPSLAEGRAVIPRETIEFAQAQREARVHEESW